MEPRRARVGAVPRRARRAPRGTGLIVALVVACAGLGRTTQAGDTELARFLVEGARDDLAKKRYDDALKKLAKARAEDTTLLEAAYWTGMVHDARKDPRAALAAYRAFKVGYDEKKASGATSKEEDALLPRVTARLDVLAASETELGRLRDAYVAQLYAFAEENFVRDPAVTTRALRLLLEVRPSHAPARKLLEKLGVAEAAEVAADTDPLGVRAWEDLIAGRVFSEADGFEYGDGSMFFGRATGQAVTPRGMERSTARYVLDAELRFTEATGDRVFGLVFGNVGDRMYMLMVCPQKLDLVLVQQGGRSSGTFATKRLKTSIERDTWVRCTLVVDGPKIEVSLDGKPELESEAKEHPDLDGIVGVYAQQCRVELRRFRLGRRA